VPIATEQILSLIYILQLVICALMPFVALIWLARKQYPSRFLFLISASMVGCFLFLIFVAARWDIAGFWLRYIWIILFVGASFIGLARHRNQPLFTQPGLISIVFSSVKTVLIFLMVFASWQLRDNRSYEGEAVEFAFPLNGPFWYVVHGGSNGFMNPHRHVRAQGYALDVTALHPFGMRAKGLIPDDLSSYLAFGTEVTAPCSGRVVATENEHLDQRPLVMNSTNLAGNHVTIACEGVFVMLAHLKQGSVTVALDDEVRVGQPIGKIGNSGSTTEPHLHIHAVREPRETSPDLDDILFEGEPMAIIFDGEFLTRNDVGNAGSVFNQ
jgi:hypothetical protein